MCGILLLGVWSRDQVVARTFQSTESRALDAALSRAASPPSVDAARPGHARRPHPSRGRAARTGVLGRLEIPRLRISAIVNEGVDMRTLARAIGHVPSTAWPGRPGNCALAGHRDSFLRGLGAVRTDDLIRFVTTDRTYLYRVEWTEVVEPRRVDVLEPTPEASLTLITCYPFAFIGHAPRRFIVRAKQIEVAGAVAGGPDTD